MAGCLSVGDGSGTPTVDDPQLLHRARETLRSLFPARCKMVHKLSLRIGSRELILTGHLLLDRERGLRAVAIDELGGPVFDFTVWSTGSRVELTPPRIPVDLLKRGPISDLRRLFLAPQEGSVLARSRDHLTLQMPSGEVMVEYLFAESADLLLGYRERKGRRVVRNTVFGYDSSEEFPGSGPRTIEITHKRLHYHLDIRLLSRSELPEAEARMIQPDRQQTDGNLLSDRAGIRICEGGQGSADILPRSGLVAVLKGDGGKH